MRSESSNDCDDSDERVPSGHHHEGRQDFSGNQNAILYLFESDANVLQEAPIAHAEQNVLDVQELLSQVGVLDLAELLLVVCQSARDRRVQRQIVLENGLLDASDERRVFENQCLNSEYAAIPWSSDAGREFSTCPPNQDGMGALCMFLLADCEDLGSAVSSQTIADADMSWPTNVVDWEMTGVPDGTWQLWGFLDDDSSGCEGDVTYGDFYLAGGCIEVTVTNQEDVTGVNVMFDSKCPADG